MATRLHTLTEQLSNPSIPINDIVTYLNIILLLRKKHGKRIYTPAMITTISGVDAGCGSLLRLLAHYHLFTTKSITTLIRDITSQHPHYTQQFTIFSPKEQYSKPIEHRLKNIFPDSTISDKRNIEMGIEITGEGWHYKRHLDQDIEKLLG